ncbi:ribosome maturation factor RimP [Corynebacterium sp. zg-331]|uniref:ribosome maturation factor RimP n=1 Tax=unclassified Corynebacterium TaxID=2624378 RepID=UPI00128B852C|nr:MULTISPECIES: ribosome maturation factor RimP [unclassified Corynebacterium]MBC3185352.1 ribosome maturation factor RimP [Corynebacterium sp. zg-331]MPV51849.1 ribosome maturation factor RimP [Corynebacterium sp. zg331]
MPFPTPEEITALARPVVEAHGHPIEGVRINRAGRKSLVAVMVDADSDTLETISGELSALFDAAEEAGECSFGPGYTLEVSTPGVDTPLSSPRHWRRNRHRLVSITQEKGGEAVLGRIGALAEDESAVILVRKEGKTLMVSAQRLDRELTAVVQIEFAQPPAEQIALTGLSFDEAMQWQEEHK